MPIQGFNFTDDEIRSALAGKTPDQIAQLAREYGMNAEQIQQATQIGGQNYSLADINSYAQSHGMDLNPGGGAPQTPIQAPQTPAGPSINIPGFGQVGAAELASFFAGGGDPNQWAQEHGITNLDTIHALATEARGLAGSAVPTGDAAMRNAWESYRRYNPNGAHANSYEGFVSSQNPGTADAIRAGTYTGAFNTQTDFQPGGIYAPGTGHDFGYSQSGLGARGMGEGWNPGAAPLGTGPQTSQPMTVNQNGALIYTGTGTSTAPEPGTPGWVQPPQGGTDTGYTKYIHPRGPLTSIYQTGQTTGKPGTTSTGFPQPPAQSFNTPMLDALYNAQQQRMTNPAPSFNFQAKPGALTQAIEG